MSQIDGASKLFDLFSLGTQIQFGVAPRSGRAHGGIVIEHNAGYPWARAG